ncbi:MAG TPA: maleylpyruvate isomerase N-terminal domain-containing protein [Thermoanaerobaculia bacterium]|nr:maleylpyruvate isomerase N-terminal domain-containing protein [Thermoanaerobaculia bacterium]
MSLPITDTRELFRPLCGELVRMLRALPAADWDRPTIAGRWRVRDVVAHLCDTALRRLSFQRDGLLPPRDAARTIASQDLVVLVNDLNSTWVRVAERFSPRVLTDLYDHASSQLVAFVETLDPYQDALFPVSWAGESVSRQWLDIGREFTEIWHHGAQIREAVGAGPFADPRWLEAVLQISMHSLPVAYRTMQPAGEDVSILIDITGPASGTWTVHRVRGTWDVDEGGAAAPTATISMTDQTAWRLLFNALPPLEARSHLRIEGNADLAVPLIAARSVIV